MGAHETYSTENEWYTPPYIFDALGCVFDVDVAAAPDPSLTHVPARSFISSDSLRKEWIGFVWCNPPWAGRGNKQPWIEKIVSQRDGLLLTPDRTSAPWWQSVASKADSILFINGKVKFIPGPENLSNYKQPGNGSTIFSFGVQGINALRRAEIKNLGIICVPSRKVCQL